jgi:hypothetical protein
MMLLLFIALSLLIEAEALKISHKAVNAKSLFVERTYNLLGRAERTGSLVTFEGTASKPVAVVHSADEAIQDVQAKLSKNLKATAVGISLMIVGSPFPVMAARTNPEAMELRRVLEEPVQAPAAEVKTKTVTLANGVQLFDAVVGDGPSAEEGKSVQFQWVLRRANGYFIDASSNYNSEPFIYKVGNTDKVIPGIDAGIRGMKVNGVRRMIIPSELAYVGGVNDDSPGPVPNDFGPRRQILNIQNLKQTIYAEIKLTKVK